MNVEYYIIDYYELHPDTFAFNAYIEALQRMNPDWLQTKVARLEEETRRQNFRSRISSTLGICSTVSAGILLSQESGSGVVGLVAGGVFFAYSLSRILRSWDLAHCANLVRQVFDEQVTAQRFVDNR